MDVPPKIATPNADQPRKRGRPAGTGNATKASSEVDQALATLETAYQFVVLGLTMVGAPQAAADLAEKIDFIQEQNKGFLTADRKLAQRIAGIGSASGRAGFIVTNIIAIAPVVIVASKEIQTRRPVKITPVQTDTAPTEDPGETDVTQAPVSTYAPVMDIEVG